MNTDTKELIKKVYRFAFMIRKAHGHWAFSDEELEQLIKMIRADEREACAKVCIDTYTGEESCGDWPTPEMCAAAIRARGNE